MQKKTVSTVLTALTLPAVLFYYETVFRLSTVRGFFQSGTVFTLLICFTLGAIGYLLCTVLPNAKWNRLIAVCLTFLCAVPFLVEYFVFRQFNIFYDLNTVFGGAADAMTGFTADAMVLIFSWDGFFKIALFLLPSALLLIFGKRLQLFDQACAKGRVAAVIAAVLLLLGARLGISLIQPLELLISDQYSFQSAVSSFGLIPGIGLDLNNNAKGEDESGFENVTFPVVTTEPTQAAEQTEPATEGTEPTATEETVATEPTEPPVVYVPNVLDIDFASLKASGTIAQLNEYVASLTPSMTNEYTGLFEGKNLIFITAEAFCAEAIDPELTPTLYRMATKGIQFTDYYQPSGSGTTGGEYQNVFGMLPSESGMSFKLTADHLNYFTIGSQLDRLGYWGRAYHNNDYTYYSRHKTHVNLGYSDGYVGFGNGMEEYVKNVWPKSDLEMFMGSLPDYIDQQPFNVYYMTVSGHSGYTKSGNTMVSRHFHRVEHLEYSDLVKGYLATQLELEDSMAYLLEQLEAKGILNDTVIVITGDHFPYGLDKGGYVGNFPYLSELYGYDVTSSFQRDHNALIMWSGCLESMEPIVVDSPTSSLDILPTLSNLFGTQWDSRLLPGRDVFSDAPALVFTSSYNWKTDYGTYYSGSGKFIPASEDIEIPEGYIDTIRTIVRNKIRYCQGVLSTDYFRYLFGNE